MKKIMFNDLYGLTKAVIDGHKTMTRRFVPDRMAQLLDVGSKGVLIIPKNSIPDSMTSEQLAKKFAKHSEVIIFEKNDVKEVKSAIDIREECIKLAPYKVGEVVAVAQSYKSIHEEMMNGDYGNSRYDVFRCAMVAGTKGWDNKMFVRADLMPHQIRITDIKVERLQDITDEDCLKECVRKNKNNYSVVYHGKYNDGYYHYPTAKDAFAALIDEVSGKGTWDRNPWVFAYSFELVI